MQREIACQQVLVDEESVFSTQWMEIPGEYAPVVTPSYLLEKYLRYIRQSTLSVIRPVTTPSGVEFRLLWSSLSLLSFEPASTEDDRTVTLAIRGGLLVQSDQCQRGNLAFVVEPAGNNLRIKLQLSDYCPILLGKPSPSLLRRWLYRFTQGLIHKRVTISFLARVYRQLAGESACVKVVRVKPETGTET